MAKGVMFNGEVLKVPETLAELGEDEQHRVVTDAEKAEWSGKQDKLTAGDNISITDDNTISAIIPSDDIDALKQDVKEIQDKIPTQASADNKLTTQNFVNSSINALAAFYITKDETGDPFATNAELLATTTFYNGPNPRVPTTNDYAIVQADETKADELGDHPTTRYSYQGGTYPNGKWVFQYIVNRTSLTAAQIAAINSNITAELTAQITTNKNNIADKASQADLTALTTRVAAAETKNTSQDTAIEKAQTTADGAVTKNTEQDAEIAKKANTTDLEDYIPKTDIKTMSAVGDIGYGEAADRQKVTSVEALSWWNGAYMGTNSNLQYFKGGEIAGKDEIPRPLWMADSIILEDKGIEEDYTIPKKNISLLAATGYTIKGSDKIIFSTNKATYLGVVKSTTDTDAVVTPKFDMATVGYVDQNAGGGADGAVLYTEQTLTADQQTQARKNIGAGTSNFDGNYSSLTGTPSLGTLASKSAITSAEITDGTIVDADISTAAAIAQSKISGLTAALNAKATNESLNAVKATADNAMPKSGGQFTGPVTWNSTSLPENASANYFMVVDNYNMGYSTPETVKEKLGVNAAANAAAAAQATADGKYTKPSTGIPATDLASAVQTSLGKADTAVQTESDPTVPSHVKSITTTNISTWNSGAADNVKYTTQTLTDTQKSQARTNIGAGTSNFNGQYSSLTGTPTLGSLASKSTITSADITDGTIMNANINASAAIAQSKIANLTTDLAAKATTEALNAVKATADGAATKNTQQDTTIATLQSTINGLQQTVNELRANEEAVDVIYDKSSEDPAINLGFTTGIVGGNSVYWEKDYDFLRFYATMTTTGGYLEVPLKKKERPDFSIVSVATSGAIIYAYTGIIYEQLKRIAMGRSYIYKFSANTGTISIEGGNLENFTITRIEGVRKRGSE